ncbi:hypothetical protein KBB48_01845 [Candidatus Shapirobacteria bacterium]|nr:hypothetical protein [Candidatus Shapirobacteria bacterium]
MNIVFAVIGIIFYLYFTWRTLREDYREEALVAFSWVALFIYLFMGRIVYGLWHWGIWVDTPGSWFEFWKMSEINMLGAYGAWLLFAVLIAKDKGWRLWSFLEDSLWSLWWLILISSVELRTFGVTAALGIAMLFTAIVRRKYRSFTWYRNGKKGFLYFWFLMIFFLVLGPIVGKYWLSLLGLIFGAGLFMLGNDKFSK